MFANTDFSSVNFKDWEPEHLATLFVGLLIGWDINMVPVEDLETLEGPPESLVDEPDPLNELNFPLQTKKDFEQEFWVIVEEGFMELDEFQNPVWRKNKWARAIDMADDLGNCFGTSSGDNPVLLDTPTQASAVRSAAGFMPEETCSQLTGYENKEQLPENDIPEYFCWRFSSQGAKRRERNMHAWVRFIKRSADNPHRLEQGRKAFWAKYFERKANQTVNDWLTKKHITLIKNYFAKTKDEQIASRLNTASKD